MNNEIIWFLGEFIGTMILIILGNGVVSNVVYKKTYGSNGNILAITFGWGFAVFIGVLFASSIGSSGHINPAVTIATMIKGDVPFIKGIIYMSSQMLGALFGQLVITGFYWKHHNSNENADLLLLTHSTQPTHSNKFINLFSEFIATSILISAVFILPIVFKMKESIFSFVAPFTMGFVVFSIGISLGGTTGFAINPARDLCPRIIYTIIPYKTKTSANWSYAWIPIVSPMAAGVVIGAFFRLV